MTRKITQNKVNKVFQSYAHDLFDKTCENAEGVCGRIFPGQPVSNEIFVLVCERLVVELGAVLTERKGKKHVSRKKKKISLANDQEIDTSADYH
jgi:hypothetical protein